MDQNSNSGRGRPVKAPFSTVPVLHPDEDGFDAGHPESLHGATPASGALNHPTGLFHFRSALI